MSRFPCFTLFVVVCSLVAVGCAEDEPEPAPQGSVGQAKVMLAPIEAAFAQPSGEVSPERMSDIIGVFQDQGGASGALGFVPGAPAAGPMGDEFGDCYSGSGTNGTVDLACASGGEITGSMSFTFGQDGDYLYMTYQYDDVCSGGSSEGGATCIDGNGAIRYTTFDDPGRLEALMAGKLVVTHDGVSEEIEYGFMMTLDGDSYSLQYAVFVNGDSYIIEVESDGTSYIIRVTGENGTWTCTASETASGWTGSCEGQSAFEF